MFRLGRAAGNVLPRSTLGLVLAGFLSVTLPLAIAIATAVIGIDRAAQRSYAAAVSANAATRHARVIAEDLLAMERALGQYAVFREEGFYRTYVGRRAALQDAATELRALNLGAAIDERLASVLDAEEALFAGQKTLASDDARALWSSAATEARALEDLSRERVENELIASAQSTLGLRRSLLIQTAAVLPLAVLMAAVFARLIMRPITQVDSAIRRLAAEGFREPIEIQGPRDLEEVGACLDALRRRVVDLEKEKLTFVRRISHELKTPLTSIRQGAELLADRSGTSPGETLEIGEMLRESSLELQRLIEDLLEFGKTQRFARERPLFARVDLANVARRVIGEHSLALKTKNITLRAELGQGAVLGDARQLRTAVNNLVANAAKYTPSGGEIFVSVAIEGPEVALHVRDSGPGIPAAERPRVFEPFYQGKPVAGSHVKGTGLGLAIAKDYVEANHGHIEILDSDDGAHFRVRLPAATEP